VRDCSRASGRPALSAFLGAALVIDDIGYLPLERQAANLVFAVVSRR
jgi:hypothetical protein